MGEILFHIFLLGILAVFGISSTNINTARATDPLGPSGFPLIILTFIGILLIVSLVKAVKRYREENAKMEITKTGLKRIILLLASLAGFALITPKIGFIISIFVLFVIMFNIMGQTGFKSLLLGLGSATAIIILFVVVLSVPLPRGLGIFKELSYLIY